jgi:hypothetical protein
MGIFGFTKKSGKDDRDGSSFESAIIIKAKNTNEGIKEEYRFIESKHGDSYGLREQKHCPRGDKHFDVMEIGSNGETFTYYFDITSFYGKW